LRRQVLGSGRFVVAAVKAGVGADIAWPGPPMPADQYIL